MEKNMENNGSYYIEGYYKGLHGFGSLGIRK